MFTSKRLGYARIVGAVLWLAWLISVLCGRGNLDRTGVPIGADFLQFYTAGYTLRVGESARLYDVPFQSQLQQHIIGPELRGYYGFITPPFLAAPFAPLSALPYRLSFLLWSLLGLTGLGIGLRLLRAPKESFIWALTWFPVFASISYGQNSLLSLTLLCIAYALWRSKQPFLAGLAASLIMYKPQLALGIVLLWLLDWRRSRSALVGLALGSGLLAGLCFALWPAASRAYIEFARTILPNLPAWEQFPLWHLHTLRGFWRLLLPGAPLVADGVTLLLDALGLLAFLRLWRLQRKHDALLFAAAIGLTLWLTPHAMIYDWSILIIPAVLLWKELPPFRPTLTKLYALVWLATLISSSFTYLQLRWLPVALQVSVPVLAYAAYRLLRLLLHPIDVAHPNGA